MKVKPVGRRWKMGGAHKITAYGSSLALVVFLLLLWQFAAPEGLTYVLPKPSMIAKTLFLDRAVLWRNAQQTILEAALGFALGSSIGMAIAVGFIYSKTIAQLVYPYAVILRSLPLLPLLPLLVGIFGTGITSKVILIILATFFPTLVNMVQGLNSVEKQAIELMDTLNASKREIFWKLRVPTSLPHLFTSMKITLPISVLAAIVSEWLYAAKGLGAFIVMAMFNMQTARLWAAMAVATMLSILGYLLVVLVEKMVVPWHSSTRAER